MATHLLQSRRAKFIVIVMLLVTASAALWLAVRGSGSVRPPVPGGEQNASDLSHASQRAGLCSSANVAGVGLRGDYFPTAGLAGAPSFTRIDTTVDFTGALPWPADQAAAPPRSVRWQGWIRPPISGRYRFHAEPTNARVLVSREAMTGPGVAEEASIQLTLGRYYPILMEVPALDPAAPGVRLEWTAPHGARFVIPRALLYLPTDTAAPAAR